MSQQSLQDLLGTIATEYKEAFDNAANGTGGPTGDWRNDLPLTLEYRVRVDKAEYKNSKAGVPQIVLTYEVLEPAEYAGAKFQDYQTAQPTTSIGSEILAKTFGALQAKLDGWGNDFQAFVGQFEDRTAVVALLTWGQAEDRIGVRYINLDRGQQLSTKVVPKGSKRPASSDLRPDIQIPKDAGEEPFPASQPAVTPPPISPPTVGGPNLPPGLR
jgi:hypothetical protein